MRVAAIPVGMGAGAGASVGSSPQATASATIAVNARTTGLTARLHSLMAWAGRLATPALASVRSPL